MRVREQEEGQQQQQEWAKELAAVAVVLVVVVVEVEVVPVVVAGVRRRKNLRRMEPIWEYLQIYPMGRLWRWEELEKSAQA